MRRSLDQSQSLYHDRICATARDCKGFHSLSHPCGAVKNIQVSATLDGARSLPPDNRKRAYAVQSARSITNVGRSAARPGKARPRPGNAGLQPGRSWSATPSGVPRAVRPAGLEPGVPRVRHAVEPGVLRGRDLSAWVRLLVNRFGNRPGQSARLLDKAKRACRLKLIPALARLECDPILLARQMGRGRDLTLNRNFRSA